MLCYDMHFITYCTKFHPTELKLPRMPDINPHNRSNLSFSISSLEALWAAPVGIFKSIHSLGILPIELKFGRVLLNISPHNLAESETKNPTPQDCALWDAPLEMFKSIHVLQSLVDWDETWYGDARYQSAQSLWAGSSSATRGQNFTICHGHHLCISLVSPSVAEICISSTWEMTEASVKWYF